MFTFLILSLFTNLQVFAEDIEDVSVNVNEINQDLNLDINNQIQEQRKQPVIPAPVMPKLELNDRVLNYSLSSSFIPPDTIVYKETQKYFNSIDPQKLDNANSYYPGMRGPNQLIIYTPSYGDRTGTNEFGTEAIVENNMVVRINGADSIIPRNGFVISGHGSAKKWITNNIQVGSKVYIDYLNNSIRVYLTPESLVFAAKSKIQEVSDLVLYYKHSNFSYNSKKVNEYLEDSRNMLKKAEKKPEKTQEYISEAMETLDEALKNAIPYNKNELKGIWVRPIERSPEEIEKTVERMSDNGITDIFLETYYHGKTIYPSNYLQEQGVISQRSEFQGFDPLRVWIDEAHKRNMKVHIWFESFYLGNDSLAYSPYHVLNIHPYWTNRRYTNSNNDQPMPCVSEHNGYFLDPANYQVQSYLLGLLQEILDVYHPDGINLDYIRYPQSVDSSYSNYVQSNWGYTPAARSEFKLLYDIDPVDISYGTQEWDLWSNYRQDKITEFLKKVKELTSDYNVKLTAVIFPDLRKSKATKMQNWKVWSMNNYVDGLTPLILTGDKNTAELLIKDVVSNVSPVTSVYPGIFVTFMGGPYEDLLIQIHKTREFNSKGAVLFDYAHFGDKYANALKTRVYNKSYDEHELKPHERKKEYNSEIRIQEKTKKRKRIRDKEDFA